MKDKPLVPPDFVVPLALDTPHFHLRPLTPTVVELDYDAVMSSIDLLQAMFGRDWPHAAFTLSENLQDLVEHGEEFEQRAAFAYTVLSPDGTMCLGCVYINPPRDYPTDARIYMWVRQSAHDQGLDPVLFHTVQTWIETSWPFARVMYPGRKEDGTWAPLGGEVV
ncbi:GNAT family N-acetyltransferase [Promineifilum sp.]|uniref:GNAT family N-acetyltransferase n=1 Tax=Promineifilum sp. TaxID=2664178 RepID=UPI0035B28629